MSRVIAYTYYNSPWELKTGDDVRIHTILSELAKSQSVIVFNLSARVQDHTITYNNGVVYVSLTRNLYKVTSKIIGWKDHYDLNPLIKITHYLDEFFAAIKLRNELAKAQTILVFGSMSIFSFIARMLGLKSKMIYDALANYAQTLYLRSRKSLTELIRYGLYLILHKLQLKSSNVIVYPSNVDLSNAKQMFKLARAFVVPNPLPIRYNSLEEYVNLRSKRSDYSRPYFLLLAGGRGKANEEAVKVTIRIFNEFPSEKFKLMITGPWLNMKSLARNPSIEILGVVPQERLKEILAVADYGLAPVFSHSAGTFIKVLAYIAAGLDVIASPYAVMGLSFPPGIKLHIVENTEDYKKAVLRLLCEHHSIKGVEKRCAVIRGAMQQDQKLEILCREVAQMYSGGEKSKHSPLL